MGRWKRDAQEVVNDLVRQRNSSSSAGEGVASWGELTLSAEGRSLHVNASLLLAVSPYLRRTLIKSGSSGGSSVGNCCGCGPKLAIIALVGVTFTALEFLVKYLYGEEVAIEDDSEIRNFLEAAKALEIEGLRNNYQNQVEQNENETVLVDEATKNSNLVVNFKVTPITSPSILEDKQPLNVEKSDEVVQDKVQPEDHQEPSTSNISNLKFLPKLTSAIKTEKTWIRPVTPPRKSNLLAGGSKKYSRQMTLPSMAKRKAVKQEKVVDLTSSEVFNGGVRKIKNNATTTLSSSNNQNQMPPPKPLSSKRKSDELEKGDIRGDKLIKLFNTSSNSDTTDDDDFKNSSARSEDLFDADATMFTSPVPSPRANPIVKRNKTEDIKPLFEDVDDDSKGENADVVKDLEETLSPVVCNRKPLSPLNKTNDELRNLKSSKTAKKKLFGEDKGNTSTTQQLFKDFNKIPERVKEDRGEKSRPTKEEKAQMEGWACPDCENWYKGLESQMHPREVERLRQQCSKHRKEKDYQPPPSTPPDFWNTSMPSTAEAYRTGLLQVLPDSYQDSFFDKD